MDLEAAFSGALGPEAQAAAFANFRESAGQKYFRERQEQALLRNAAAIGGIGGGRVRTALQERYRKRVGRDEGNAQMRAAMKMSWGAVCR